MIYQLPKQREQKGRVRNDDTLLFSNDADDVKNADDAVLSFHDGAPWNVDANRSANGRTATFCRFFTAWLPLQKQGSRAKNQLIGLL